MASWLLRSAPDRVVRVRALAGHIVLCSWARHLTPTVPLSTQEYKRVPANCWGNLTNCGGVTYDGVASRPGGVEILPTASCYRNRDKIRQLWVIGSKTSLHFHSSSGEILIGRLCLHHFGRRHGNQKLHVRLAKNQLFWHNSVFFPLLFISCSN